MKPTPQQLDAIRRARGGETTYEGTREHCLFEEMCELGWVKEVTIVDGGIVWRLSGDGLLYAYDEMPRPNIVLDPEVVARFLQFARSFADDESLSDDGLTGADLRHLADYVERAQGSAIIARLT